MNHLSTNPIGIDKEINSLQTELYALSTGRWLGTINGYGRVYRNERQDGKIVPQRHISQGDYEDVFFDDNTSGNFFFLDNETHVTKDGLVYTAEVKIVFMVNLKSIFNDTVGRQDERCRRDAAEFLREICDERFSVKRIEKGVKAVFVNIDRSKLDIADHNPLHVFALVVDMPYYITDKCD